MKTLLVGLLLAASLVSSGCTSTSYTDPSGAKFSRISLLNSQAAQELTVKAGDKELTLKGYTSEQAAVASSVVSAAIKAAIKP